MYLIDILESQTDLLQNQCYERYLHAYFPPALSNTFKSHFVNHPLANQIKATMISNLIVNQAGCSFLSRQESGRSNILGFVNSYLTFDQVLKANELRLAIAELDNQVAADIQYQLLLHLEQTLAALCRWSATHRCSIYPEMGTITTYQQFLKDYENYLNEESAGDFQVQIDHYQQAGVPLELAKKVATIANLHDFLFITSLVSDTQHDFKTIGKLLDDIHQTLGIYEILQRLSQIPMRDYWVRTVCNTLRADIQQFTAQLVKYPAQSRKNLHRLSRTACPEIYRQLLPKNLPGKSKNNARQLISVFGTG